MLKTLLAASAGLVGTAHAFWRMECPGRVGLARIDPIVNFGEPANHVHAIHGSGALSMNSATTDELLDADCTSCRVTQDKSAYWAPAMYFKDGATGKMEAVEQVGGMLAYYLLNGQKIKGFPKDFRMLAGDTERRSFSAGNPEEADPAKSNWAALGQIDQKDLEERSIGFNCLNYAATPEATLYRHYLPEKQWLDANCKDGLRLEIMFPSCWDGENTDSDDHKGHVAYPDMVMSGTCPESHPVSVPGLLFETIWDTQAFDGRDGIFVMANGDPTGFGYHADFMMGWDEDFLQQAVDTCTNQSGRIQDCPLFDIISEAEARTCAMNLPSELSGEDVTKSLLNLPGGVSITYKEGQDDGSSTKPEKPEVSGAPQDDDGLLDGIVPTLPSPEIPEAVPTIAPSPSVPGNVFKESSVYEAPPPTDVAAVADTTEVPPPPPTTTAAPEIVPVEDPNVSYFSTQYITNGNIVTKIYWDQEVVMVTEVIDTTTTVTAPGPAQAPAPTDVVPAPEAPAPVRRHLHNHVHRHI